MPNSGVDTRILIARGNVSGQQRDPFAVYGEDPEYRLYIHISNPLTEKVYFGLGQNSGSAVNWRIHAPDGTVAWPPPPDPPAQTPTTGQGFISTYNQAYNGPDVLNPAGYNALHFQPTESGDYFMTFEIGNGQQRDFRYFDITVVNTNVTPNVAIPGRVFSKCWQIRNPQPWGTNRFQGNMYIYSLDGIVTKLDPNNMEGRDFSFSSNESGCYQVNPPSMTSTEARRSQTGRHTYPQFPIFLNDPDNLAYPSGTIGELIIPPPPTPAVVTTSYCATGTIDFTFSVSQAGSVQIDLMLNAALGPPYVDRQIVEPVQKYGNTITWDGFDGAIPPHPVPNGTLFNFSLTYINGMTHLPLYDVESNSGGFRVYLVRPPSTPPKFYWDDIHIPGGSTNLTGCQSGPTSTCHPWGDAQGDQNTMNTWWYVSNTSTAPVQITERRTPGDLGNITGPVDVCEGGTATYTITAHQDADYYSWTLPGGGTVTTTTTFLVIDFTGLPVGIDLIKVQGINDCGGGPKSTLEVNIHALPVASITGADAVCKNSTSTYTTQPGMSNYAWTVTPGGTIVSGSGTNQIQVNWPSAGTQSISISYDDPYGCGVPTPSTKTVTVSTLPTATLSGTTTVCQNDPSPVVVFTGSEAVPPYTFSYKINGGPTLTVTTTTGSSISVPVSTAIPGTYVYQLVNVTESSAANCSQVQSGTATVTVNPLPTATISGNTTVCKDAASPVITFTGGSATPPYIFTYNINGGASQTISTVSGNSVTLSVPTTTAGTYTYNLLSVQDGSSTTCSQLQSGNATIIVNPIPDVDPVTGQVVCNGAATSQVTFSGAVTGTVYSWTNSLPSINLPASGTGNIASFNAVNLSTAPVTATITVTPSYTYAGETCTGPPTSFTITVNPTAQVNQPESMTVCNGGTASSTVFITDNTGGTTTYEWSNDNTSIGLGASGTGDIAAFTALNTGTSPVMATITVTPTFTNGGSSCQGPSKSFTITVNPTAQVNAVASQVVCNGLSTSPVPFGTLNTGGTTTYSWTNDNTTIGLAATGTGDISSFTAINNGTSPVVATITVTPHFENNSVSCDGPSTSFTITVNPSAQVNQPSPQTVCHNAPTSDITFSTNNTGGVTEYEWTNNTPSIGLAASGSGDIPSFTAINTGSSPVMATITVEPEFENSSVSCEGIAKTFTITVNPLGQVNQPSNQVVCHNALTTLVAFSTVSTGGTTTYNWTNDNTSIGLGASGTGDILPFTAINTGTSPVVATITVTPFFTNNGVTCQGPVKTFTITVNPPAQVNQPASQVICHNATSAQVTFTTNLTGGTTTYSWTNDTPSIGLSASGNGDIPPFTAQNITTAPVVATITVTPHFDNGSTNCDGPPKTFTFTVNPLGQLVQPDNQTICNNASTTAVAFTTTNTGGTTTYAWSNDNTSIGLGASGTGDIPAFTTVNTGTSPVVATITVTPTFTNGGSSCQGPSKSFTITVNPTAQVDAVNPQVLCNGQNTSQVNFSTVSTGGTTTYTWVNNTPGIGLAATGTGNIAPFAAVNAGTSPIVATITVTPHFENNSVTCDGPTTSFTITVNPSAQVSQPANQTVCHNASTTGVVFTTTSTGGTTTYSWTNDNTSIGLGASGNGDIPSFTAINTGTSPVVATITVTPHFENGSVNCDGPTKSFTITVNPLGQVNQPASQVVCHNALTTLVTFTTNLTGGTTTYNWTNDNASIGLTASGTGDIPPFTAINTGLTPAVATITVTPFFTNNGVTCQGPVKTFTITVNPPAQVNQPASQVICHNATSAQVTFTTNLTGGTTTYSWTNDTPSIGLSASGNGDIPPFTAQNITTAPVVATITVTPHFDNGSTNCDGPPKTFTFTVNPLGQVVQPSNQTVCNNASTAVVVFATLNTGGTTTYAWTNDNTSIGLAASGNGNIAAFTALNSGTTPVVATITVTPTFTNGGSSCQGPSKSFTITVNPTPGVVFNPASTPTICTASQASILFDPTVSGTTFNWNVPSLPTGVTMVNVSGTGNVSEIINNTTNIPQTVVFNVMPVAATCSPASPFTYSVVVNPKPTVVFPASPANPQQVCSGAVSTPVPLSSSVTIPGVTYAWTAAAFDPVNPTAAISGFTTPNSGSTIPGENIVSSLLTQGVIKYTVTPTFTNAGVGCPGDAQLYQTLVNPSPTVALNPTDPTGQSICSGGTSQLITFTPNATPTIYTWQAVENVGVAGAITSGTTDHIPAQTLTTTGPAQGHVRYQVTPIYQGGGSFTCPGGVSFSTIFVNPNPTPVIAGKSLACELGPNETYSTPAIAGHSYSWTVTGGTITSDPTQNQITVTWGPYTVSPGTLVVTETIDATGCVTTTPPYQVVLQQRPIPTLNGPVSVCDGSTGKVYQTETGMSNYEWTIQGGTITSGGGTSNPSATVTWNTVGVQWIQVNYINAIGCPGYPAKKLDVTVNPLPVTTITDGPGPHCEGAPHTYQVPNDPQCSFNWSVSPASRGTIASGQGTSVVSINWLTAGPATIAVTGTNNITTCVNSSTHAVTVNPKPLPTFNACFDLITTPSSRKFILRGATPWVTGQGVFSGTRVALNTATGNYEFDPFGASAGTYPVTYTFTNNFGCVNQAGPVTISVVNTSFSCGAELTDPRDGRKYRTSLIGGKCWMAENLAYGTSVDPLIAMTDNCVNERYCLNSDPSCTSYGALYQWDELMKYASTTGNQGLCPPEWHVPTETEWQQLIDNISVGVPPPANGIAGGFLKDMVLNPGFFALMKGIYYQNNTWSFSGGSLTATMFWTSTTSGSDRAVARGVNLIVPSSSRYPGNKANAFSVRCVKD